MFAQTDEEVWVLTDTLAADSDGAPAFYTDKCLPVPRMRMLIAGTGTHNIVFECFKFVETRIRALDMEMLNEHTPDALRLITAELVERYGPVPGTTTIYYFGVLRDGSLGRYTYRSERDWEPEFMSEVHFGMKPNLPGDLEEESLATLDSLIDLANRVKAHEDARPAKERIHIGGHLVMTLLTTEGTSTRIVAEFDDHINTWQRMNNAPEIDVAGLAAD